MMDAAGSFAVDPPPAPEGDASPRPAKRPKRRRLLPPEGDPLRYSYGIRARCPKCESDRLRSYHVIEHSDDVHSFNAQCADCGACCIVQLD